MLWRVLLQVLVDESDRHAALTDRGSNALYRAQPHIATGESAGSTRFEEERIAVMRPAPGLDHIVTGQDISSIITRDVRRQPPGLRIGANEDEKAAAFVLLHLGSRAITYVDCGQMGVATR